MLKNNTHSEAFEYFKKNLRLNDTIYCIVRHVSKSAMTRHIAFFDIKNNDTSIISSRIADLLGYKMNKDHDAVIVGGCGSNMAFTVINNLQETMNASSFASYKLNYRIL